MELSIIIPCLNEEETLGTCLNKATTTLNKNNVNYEIIVADNGSQDNSIQIASSFKNVRIVNVQEKGYGIAIRTGIAQANGKYILMADADDSYDFNIVLEKYSKLNDASFNELTLNKNDIIILDKLNFKNWRKIILNSKLVITYESGCVHVSSMSDIPQVIIYDYKNEPLLINKEYAPLTKKYKKVIVRPNLINQEIISKIKQIEF